MAVERTLGIIKPDAVEKNHIGGILAMIEAADLRVVAMKMIRLSRHQARGFYAVHDGKPFFDELIEFMTRGPVVVLCLEGDNAIKHYRGVMGATDPAKADAGTIRKKYGTDIGENATHGSDAPETAAVEVGYFFPGHDLI